MDMFKTYCFWDRATVYISIILQNFALGFFQFSCSPSRCEVAWDMNSWEQYAQVPYTANTTVRVH